MDEDDERIFMVGGEDANGDQHIFMTTSVERVIAEYRRNLPLYVNVRGNLGFEEDIRPTIDRAN